MNTEETTALLEFVCGYELRTVPHGAVDAWQDVLGDVNAEAAMAAARKHFRMHATTDRPPRLTPYGLRAAALRGER